MGFAPFLHFQGNCAEAMTHYAKLFGATELTIQRYSDSPEGAGVPASNRVMYSHVTAGNSTLMASDYPEGMPGEEQKSVTISWDVPTVAEGQALYAKLAEGGAPIMPYGKTFWSEGFGMVRDRFGTAWMISVRAG
jgi:PhnB protein